MNGVIKIPVAKVSDGEAHFYRYPDGGKELKFFVVKGDDEGVRAAFDSCDSASVIKRVMSSRVTP